MIQTFLPDNANAPVDPFPESQQSANKLGVRVHFLSFFDKSAQPHD